MQEQPSKSAKQEKKNTLHHAANMKRRKCDHSENSKSRMSKDEQAVQDLATWRMGK